MTTAEVIEKWLVDHSLEYTYSTATVPHQFGVKDPRSLIIVGPGPDFDDHVVIVWNTRTHRRNFDTHLNIADPEFFEKFETALR